MTDTTNNPLSEEETKNVTEMFLETVMNNDGFAADDRNKLRQYANRHLPDYFLTFLTETICENAPVKANLTIEQQKSSKRDKNLLAIFLETVINNNCFHVEDRENLKRFAQKKQSAEFLFLLKEMLRVQKEDKKTFLNPKVCCVSGAVRMIPLGESDYCLS